MAKKYRVYRKGGSTYETGGNYNTTQDSNSDNIPQQKADKFTEWLRKNTRENILKGAMQADIEFVKQQAQQGGSIPNYDVYSTHGYMQFLENMNKVQPSPEKITIDPEDEEQLAKEIAEDEAAFEPVPEGAQRNMFDEAQMHFQQLNQQNPYLLPTVGIGALQAAAYIGNRDERQAEKERFEARQANVHNIFATIGADRGDYMVNAPGIGDPLRPDEHLRKGFNTKVAQIGGAVGDELELTEEEIAQLRAQGYELDII